MNIFLVIPSRDEGKRLDATLKAVSSYFPLNRVVVVDDGSCTAVKIPPKFPVMLLRHQINLGKGAALLTGTKFAFKKGADAVIFMDADGQHDPAEIPKFIKHLQKGYDLVLGSRRPKLDTPLVRFLGNKAASLYISLLFGAYVTDLLSGFRAVNKKAFKLLKWQSSNYGV